jgi:UDP-3-O-[3-hydroxymyristoyl] glucosamine N-acyltransferase
MPRLTLDEIAALTGGRVEGDGSRAVTGAAPPHAAGPDDLTFVFNERALGEFLASPAAAAIVSESAQVNGRAVIRHAHGTSAMPKVLAALYPDQRPEPGVHPAAVVHPSARVGARVHVGPYAVVEKDAALGDDVVVGAGCYVGARCTLGEGTRLHPQSVLYADVRLGKACVVHSGVVLGADGFGFVRSEGRHVKIPQVAGVVLGDDVEIGANTCIDRGTMTPTRIGTNTKIDNLAQVGHNCEIGDRVIVCGQAALAGSTIIEDDVTLAGAVGAAGHLTIGRGAVAVAGTGITSDVEPGARIAGYPHAPLEQWRRVSAVVRHLPEMKAELRRLGQRVAELEAEIRATGAAESE